MTQKLHYLKEKYEVLQQVGEGTYGKVYKGRCLNTGKLVALKKFRIETEKEGFSITAVREIKILQQVDHPNIINMNEIIMAQPPDKDVFIVFDYSEHDLSGMLRSLHAATFFTPSVIKFIMYQLLDGLLYLHEEANVLHRDMKGSNILIDKFGLVKLADFGLARSIDSTYDGSIKNSKSSKMVGMTNRVITLWYRPPEILLGSDTYGTEVDIWGLGCIFAEIFLRKAVFSGSDEVSQLEAILYGLATEQTDPEAPLMVLSNLPWYGLIPESLKQKFKPSETEDLMPLRKRLDSLKDQIDPKALNLLFKMLHLDPLQRITCREALQDSYFDECKSRPFLQAYKRHFETSEFFNSEFKSAEPKVSQ